jgi:hypothetical protein
MVGAHVVASSQIVVCGSCTEETLAAKTIAMKAERCIVKDEGSQLVMNQAERG